MEFYIAITHEHLNLLKDNDFWQVWDGLGKVIKARNPKLGQKMPPYYDYAIDNEVLAQACMR